MIHGLARVEEGRNQGAQPILLQVLKGDIKVVLPNTFAEAEPVFPWKA